MVGRPGGYRGGPGERWRLGGRWWQRVGRAWDERFSRGGIHRDGGWLRCRKDPWASGPGPWVNGSIILGLGKPPMTGGTVWERKGGVGFWTC